MMRSKSPAISPLVGIVVTIIATAIAVLLVPHEYRPAGAMFLPGLVMAIGLIGLPVVMVFTSPAAAFRIENLLMVGLTYWILLDLLQGAYDLSDSGRTGVCSALIAIGVFATGIWSAGLMRAWKVPTILHRACRAELSAQTCFWIILACAAITLFRYAWPCRFDVVLMVKSLAGNRWDAPWVRGALGGWESFIDHLPYFGYLLPTLTVLLANKQRSWFTPSVAISIVLTIIIIAFLAHGGSRRIIGVMIGSALICWVSLPNQVQRPGTFIIAGVAAALLLLVMQVMLEYRVVGYGKMFDKEQHGRSYQHLHVDDNFLRLAQIIEMIPDQHEFTREKTITWILVRPVPRVLWPGKPTSPGFELHDVVGIRQTTLSCSAVGELYMSWGWLAVWVGGWFYGRLAGVVNQILSIGNSPVRFLMYAAGAMALFAGVRSMLDLVLMSYMVVAWYFLVLVLKLPVTAETSAELAQPAASRAFA
jgi:hypothetical protein